jgi:cholesterol oxidase
MEEALIFDYIIIGSGFGGSVASMRLSEKGYKVLVLEKGRRYTSDQFPESDWNLKKFLWIPFLGWKGILQLKFFKQMFVLSGSGVGGGSLVYANALMEPEQGIFKEKDWPKQHDWYSILKPFYNTGRRMLGSVRYDDRATEDNIMFDIAKELGRESTFAGVEIGVYMGDPDQATDPYFKGKGPLRKGCTGCASCITGCRENAKNSLDKNYLFFAENNGVKIQSETKAFKIEYIGGQYHIHAHTSGNRFKTSNYIGRNIVISAGVLGTLELLLKQKFRYHTLPALSDMLGYNIRSNSQSMSGVVCADLKLNNGPSITSVFSPSPGTHVELVKFNNRSGSVTHLSGFACESSNPWKRMWKLIGLTLRKPGKFIKLLITARWCHNSVLLLVMQSMSSSMQMIWKKSLTGGHISFLKENTKVPTYIPEGQDILYKLAAKTGATPMNSIAESLFNMSTTAHIIGGCPMGRNSDEGVVDETLQVNNYPGMYVMDSSIIPCNLGVNPSLTITALSEYACNLIPEKPGNTIRPLEDQLA